MNHLATAPGLAGFLACAVGPLFAAGPARATLVTSHIPTDADLLALMAEPHLVAEGRIGNNALNGTHELDLGQDTGAPATTANLVWPNGTPVEFSLSFDAGAGMATFEMGGRTLTYLPLTGFTDVFVRTRAVNAGITILIDQLVLDGEIVTDQSSAIGSGLDILRIRGGSLGDGFVLTGRATFSWGAGVPSQSQLAFQVKVGAPSDVVSVDAETWAGVKALHR
jgi:hypothetical protein